MKVIFKKEGDSVVAFFPELPGTLDPCTCASYAHIGQHSSASVLYASSLKPARGVETLELTAELIRQGYANLKTASKFTSKDEWARFTAIKESSK
jgi:hypothetical protein